MIFVAHIIDAMQDLLNIAGPVLFGLLIRNVGLVAVMVLIWVMIVEAIVGRMAEQEELVIDHSAVFLARIVAGLLAAALAWCIVTLVRKRARPH